MSRSREYTETQQISQLHQHRLPEALRTAKRTFNIVDQQKRKVLASP